FELDSALSGSIRERLFQRLFPHIRAFALLYEDSDVDIRRFGVGPGSRVLAISGAGCGVAGLLTLRPAPIHAGDVNPHHLPTAAAPPPIAPCPAARGACSSTPRSPPRPPPVSRRSWRPTGGGTPASSRGASTGGASWCAW